ncbi:MAG TPA: hypothetical protein VIJ51_14835 [Solirubrobacteraceae bacterium]
MSRASRLLTFRAYGVDIQVEIGDPGLLAGVRDVLPPGAQEIDPAGPSSTLFALSAEGDVQQDGRPLATGQAPVVQIVALEAAIRTHVAVSSPDYVFVHAGVVAVGDRALLVPGFSFAGKTTLVAELVRRGATYYSDEYAVLDASGQVHPYPKKLSLRLGAGRRQTETSVTELGGRAGTEPAQVALVAVTSYRPGAVWSPVRLSAGRGALLLLAHTVPARLRPEESLAAVRRAADGAIVLEGERGPAELAAGDLLTLLAA